MDRNSGFRAALAAAAAVGAALQAPNSVAQVGQTEMASRIVPVTDHHQHLLSPSGAAWVSRIPAPAETVPTDVMELLRERAARWNEPTRLAELYTEGSTVLSDLEPRFLSGPEEAGRFLGTRFARPYQLTPRAFQQSGNTASVAGFYTRGDGAELRKVGHFYMVLARGPSGPWRISAEIPAFPAPPAEPTISAERMIAHLDAAGIRQAAILSDAYWFDSIFEPDDSGNYARVRAENDWTAEQVARYPDRLVAFCSFNPLREHAAAELQRCAASGRFVGIKLHLRSSGVDLTRADHVDKLRAVFASANRAGLPIVIHVRGGEDYGRVHAQALLERVISAAPDVMVQIAHLWGGENYSPSALAAYADAFSARHPSTRNLYFDVSDAALVANGSAEVMNELVARIRQIGIDRMLYGSDAPMEGHPPPAESWQAFRSLPLTEAEFRTIAGNVAPYMRRNR